MTIILSVEEKSNHVFLKGKCFGCVLACAAFGLQKNDASQLLTTFNALSFHGAAKVQALVFSTHDQALMNFTTTLITVSTTRARASVWWVRAELARYKASTNNWALAASLFPPAKKIRRPMTVQAQVVK
jgi:hypothetical protein